MESSGLQGWLVISFKIFPLNPPSLIKAGLGFCVATPFFGKLDLHLQ